MKTLRFAILLFLAVVSPLFSQSTRILLDEEYDDWSNIAESYSDTQNDQSSGIIDFGNI